MGEAAVRAEDVQRVASTAAFAQWGVGAVVMVGSAASAGIAFHALHEHWAIGVITGLGVDLALASALIIGKRLREVGITTFWGSVLLWLTGGMTLCLNSGAAAATGHWVLAIAHAFLPVLLVALCEFGAEAQLKLHRLALQAAAEEQSARDRQIAADRARYDADQSQVLAQRREQQGHLERVTKDRARAAELELANQREARAHDARQMTNSLAAVLAMGATLRRAKRTPRPTRPRQAVPSKRPAPVPITDELVSRARALRVQRAAKDLSTGRAVLQREFGLTERTARELARQLDKHPLHAIAAR